jgi:hypothetical protein
MTKLAYDNVEDGIVKRQFFDIALARIDLDIRDLRIIPQLLQQLRREIDCADARSGKRRGNGNDSGAASHIQQTLTGGDFRMPDQPGGRWGCKRVQCEVGPILLLCLLEFFQ